MPRSSRRANGSQLRLRLSRRRSLVDSERPHVAWRPVLLWEERHPGGGSWRMEQRMHERWETEDMDELTDMLEQRWGRDSDVGREARDWLRHARVHAWCDDLPNL